MKETKPDRRRWTRAEINHHLDAWKQSGLSRKKFALQNGINPNTFSRWVTLRGDDGSLSAVKQAEKSKSGTSAFLKVDLPAPSFTAQMELISAEGLRLFFYSEPSTALLKELFRP